MTRNGIALVQSLEQAGGYTGLTAVVQFSTEKILKRVKGSRRSTLSKEIQKSDQLAKSRKSKTVGVPVFQRPTIESPGRFPVGAVSIGKLWETSEHVGRSVDRAGKRDWKSDGNTIPG